MTRWLQAAQRATDLGTKPTKPTKPAPKAIEGGTDTTGKGVLSVSSVLSEGGRADPAPPARPDGLDPDAGAYLDRLHLHGPASYGAMASAMGWGATRAWRAEAKLRAAGLVVYREGRAVPVASHSDNQSHDSD